MKKIICLLLVFLFIFVSCTESNNKKNEDINELKELLYTIYSSSSDAEDETSKGTSTEKVTFDNISQKDFDFSDKTTVTNANAPDKKEFKSANSNISMSLTRSYTTSISKCDNEKLVYIGKIDMYETDDMSAEAHYRQDTEELVFFLNYGAYEAGLPEGILSDENAKEIADKLFIELYGNENLKYYTDNTIYQSDDKTSVLYKRYVHGYETDDTVRFDFNKAGELIALNSRRMGIFEDAEETISKADIEKAVKVLTDTLGEKWTTFEPRLTIDSTGTYFVVMGASNGDYAEQFYININ